VQGAASEETRFFENDVPHNASVMSLTFLVESLFTYTSPSKAKQAPFMGTIVLAAPCSVGTSKVCKISRNIEWVV